MVAGQDHTGQSQAGEENKNGDVAHKNLSARRTASSTRRQGDAPASDLFGCTWPTVERRLRGMLRAQGSPPHLIDDISQDVALRVLTSNVAYTNEAELWPWVATVGRRLLVDAWRSRRLISSAAIPETADWRRIEDVVEARDHFHTTLAVIGTLPERAQRQLIDLVREQPLERSGPLPSRVKVALHRARRQLLMALANAGVVLAVSLRAVLRRPRVPIVGATIAVLIPLTALLGGGSPRSPQQELRGSADRVDESRIRHSLGQTGEGPVAPLLPRAAAQEVTSGRTPGLGSRTQHPAPELMVSLRYPTNVRPASVVVRPRQGGDHLLCVTKLPNAKVLCIG